MESLYCADKCVCWNPRIRFRIKFVQCLYLVLAIPEQHGIALIQAAVYRNPFFTTEHSGAQRTTENATLQMV